MSRNEKQGAVSIFNGVLCVLVCCTYACFLCRLVHLCSCGSVSGSTIVSGWAGNGRMKLWQRAVTPTPLPRCAVVSACLINVLKSVAHGEISVSGRAWLGLCCPLCSRSGVYTLQRGGMCCIDMSSSCDWSALSVPASVTFSVITLDTFGLRKTHVCVYHTWY